MSEPISQEAKDAAFEVVDEVLQPGMHQDLSAAFARFEALIRADAYEQAAKVAEAYDDPHTAPMKRHLARAIAYGIRTLSEQSAKTRQDQGDGEEA